MDKINAMNLYHHFCNYLIAYEYEPAPFNIVGSYVQVVTVLFSPMRNSD